MELVEFPWAGARSSDSGEASDSKGSMDDDELSLTAHDIQKWAAPWGGGPCLLGVVSD